MAYLAFSSCMNVVSVRAAVGLLQVWMLSIRRFVRRSHVFLKKNLAPLAFTWSTFAWTEQHKFLCSQNSILARKDIGSGPLLNDPPVASTVHPPVCFKKASPARIFDLLTPVFVYFSTSTRSFVYSQLFHVHRFCPSRRQSLLGPNPANLLFRWVSKSKNLWSPC